MFTLLPGKRRWQKVMDVGCEKRRREEPITDKTRLLGSRSGDEQQTAGELYIIASGRTGEEEGEEEETCLHRFAKLEGVIGSQRLNQLVVDMDDYLAASEVSKQQQLAIASELLSVEDGHKWCDQSVGDRFSGPTDRFSGDSIVLQRCGSWRGFKGLLRRQFMPFNTGRGEQASQGLHLLRHNEVEEGSDSSNRASKVLMPRTNLVELRKMDAKIQDGMNKSAFLTGSRKFKPKGGLEPSHKRCNLENVTPSKAGAPPPDLSMGSLRAENQLFFRKKARQENTKRHTNLLKEGAILRKLMQRTQKGQALLLNADPQD